MLAINVRGGTNAGVRIVKPSPKPWSCCGVDIAAYLSKCQNCGGPRPN
jgi:hypothetical protein